MKANTACLSFSFVEAKTSSHVEARLCSLFGFIRSRITLAMQAPDKEADACPENVGREDIKAARHLASKLGLKKPPKLPKQQPNNSDSAKSKPRNGRQSPKSSRSKNGRSKTPEKAHGPVKGHQPNAEAKKQPRNNNNPAFLAVQPDRTAQPVFANGRMANGSAAGKLV